MKLTNLSPPHSFHLWALVSLALLFSCREDGAEKTFESNSTINQESKNPDLIDITQPLQEQALSDFLAVKEVIPLETSIESAMQGVSQVLLVEDKFVLLDRKSSSVKVFSKKGEYLHEVGGLGRGPGEFFHLHNIERVGDSLLIFGRTKAAYFDLTGKFIQEFPLSFFPEFACATQENHYAFHMNNNNSDEVIGSHNLVITDADFEIIATALPFVIGKPKLYQDSGYLTESSKGVLAHTSFADTVFEYDIRRGHSYPKYTFDFGIERTPLSLDHPELMKTRRDEGFLRSPFYESEDAFFMHYVLDGRYQAGFWLREQEVLLGEESFENNDLMFHLFPPKGEAGDGTLIGVIVPGEAHYTVPDYASLPQRNPDFLPFLQENYPQLYEVSKDLDGSENPILVLYEIHPEGAAAALNQK